MFSLPAISARIPHKERVVNESLSASVIAATPLTRCYPKRVHLICQIAGHTERATPAGPALRRGVANSDTPDRPIIQPIPLRTEDQPRVDSASAPSLSSHRVLPCPPGREDYPESQNRDQPNENRDIEGDIRPAAAMLNDLHNRRNHAVRGKHLYDPLRSLGNMQIKAGACNKTPPLMRRLRSQQYTGWGSRIS